MTCPENLSIPRQCWEYTIGQSVGCQSDRGSLPGHGATTEEDFGRSFLARNRQSESRRPSLVHRSIVVESNFGSRVDACSTVANHIAFSRAAV